MISMYACDALTVHRALAGHGISKWDIPACDRRRIYELTGRVLFFSRNAMVIPSGAPSTLRNPQSFFHISLFLPGNDISRYKRTHSPHGTCRRKKKKTSIAKFPRQAKCPIRRHDTVRNDGRDAEMNYVDVQDDGASRQSRSEIPQALIFIHSTQASRHWYIGV